MSTITIDNKFTVRIVNEGDEYGRNFCLINDGEPLVEFYDVRYPHTEYGQFVSRYRKSTLIGAGDRLVNSGLSLDGSSQEWSVTPNGMRQVVEFIKSN